MPPPSSYLAHLVFLSHKTSGTQPPLPLLIPQQVFIALTLTLTHPDVLISTIKFYACSMFYASKYMYQYVVHHLLPNVQ